MQLNSDLYQLLHRTIDFGGLFLDAGLIVFLVSHYLAPRFDWQKKPWFSAVSILFVAAFIYLFGYSKDFSLFVGSIFLAAFFYSLFFSGAFYRKLMLVCVYCSLSFLWDGIYLSVYNFLVSSYTEVPWLFQLSIRFFQRIACKLLMFLLICFLLRNSKDLDGVIPRSYSACILIFCGFDLILMLFHIFYISPSKGNLYASPFATFFMCGCFLMILCFFYLLTAIVKNYQENMAYRIQNRELELHSQYLESTKDFITASRQFRHDMKAHLFCMEGLLEQKKYKELGDYMQQFQASAFLNPPIRSLCSDEILNTLLNQKMRVAENHGIPLCLSISLEKELFMEKLDLCGILSNLLDNAIEASCSVPDPKISLELKDIKGYITIQITNRTAEDPLKSNPGLSTTKKEKELHGLGLSIIRNLVRKYHGSVDFTSTSHSFSCFILLENMPGCSAASSAH